MRKKWVIFFFVLILLTSLVSAGIIDDVWDKITGSIVNNQTERVEEICGDGICQEDEVCDVDCCEAICTLECPAGAVEGSCGCECIELGPNPPIETEPTPPPESNGGGGVIEEDTAETSEPTPTICATKIDVTFDKDVYYIGDTAKIVVEVLDSEGNPLPNYVFYTQTYDGIWHTPGEQKTDSSGYFRVTPTVEKEQTKLGKMKFKVYTESYTNCNSVEDTTEIEIKGEEQFQERVPCGIGNCIPEEVVEEVEAIPEEKVFYKCNGCELGGKCYPMGYRKEGRYCSDDYEFVNQIEGTCDNSFECKSNVCISGECVGEGLIKKFMKWLRNLFGEDEEDEKPGLEMCSKLLIEKNIKSYEYVESEYGNFKETQVPLYSEEGQQITVIKCCAALYKHKEKDEQRAAIVCPYDNRENLRTSLIWILAREGIPSPIDYKDEIVYGDTNEVIIWTSDEYLVATGGDIRGGGQVAEEIADAYLKKYKNDLDITEDEIPHVPQPDNPESWIHCNSETDMLTEECHFIEDFEGSLERWTFSSGGQGYNGVGNVEVEDDGNTYLRIVGVERANVHRIWDNYLFKFRFKMVTGNVHADFRRSEGYEDGARRYLVSINDKGVLNLNEQMGRDFQKLEDIDLLLDDNWHTLEVRCYDDIMNVYVDNRLVAKHKDTTNTLFSGWVRFEVHTGGSPVVPELFVDDVEVRLITQSEIIYP